MLIRTIDHQYVHNIPIFGQPEWFSLSDRCQDVSSFVVLLFIFIHGDGTVPSILEMWLAEVPTGGVVVDAAGVVTSFTLLLPFAFLALVVGYTALVRFLEPAIFGHVANTSALEASRLLSVGSVLPLAHVAFAFLRQGIDLHVVWSLPVVGRHCCALFCRH